MSCKVLVRSHSDGYINPALVGAPKELKRGGSFSENVAKRIRVMGDSSEEGSHAPIGLSEADQKLQRNFEEVLRLRNVDPEKIPLLLALHPPQAIELHTKSSADQGKRPAMEDAHFHCKLSGGYLIGIFDGHGDKGKISKLAAEVFQTRFPQLVEEKPGRWQEHFERICRETHEKVETQAGGSTALVSYFCTNTNYLLTTNLGDSHAMIFRKVGDVIESIPISAERNWCHPEEEERVRVALNDSERFNRWSEAMDPKMRRYPPVIGVNVSRALGNKSFGEQAISKIPITTLTQVREGDLIVWGCDGLWDFVPIPDLIDEVIACNWGYARIADRIVDYAVLVANSSDNVSVICAWAKDPSAPPLEEMPATPVIDDGMLTPLIGSPSEQKESE